MKGPGPNSLLVLGGRRQRTGRSELERLKGLIVSTFDPSGPSSDPALVPYCEPISATDPCGPDLDLAGDADYLNFFAQLEGILPTSFFSLEDGKPFDPSTIDINGHLGAIEPLLERSHDIRLLTAQARLQILKKDLAGFVQTVATIAEWLERFWDTVHPQIHENDVDARWGAISALDLTTVIFPLQYVPLLEGRRVGMINYRAWMIAVGDVKPRLGEATLAPVAITEAIADAEPAALAAVRRHLTLLNASLERIRAAFQSHGHYSSFSSLPALAGKMLVLSDPYAATVAVEVPVEVAASDDAAPAASDTPVVQTAAAPPNSIADAAEALAAIAEYYSQYEPSSPALPLVRQAHQLIGKSFIEIMTILMPSQVDKAAFQIGTEQVFDLPLEKLSSLSGVSASGQRSEPDGDGELTPPDHLDRTAPRYRPESRAQALALLDQVQRYFRHSEPSSPVPMLCERARALAERDFMGVLRDVLPKSALKNFGAEK
jgi:type VI secretion system protein ImpA